MKDRRRVDDMSAEELERLLHMRRREQRLASARQAGRAACRQPHREPTGAYAARPPGGKARLARPERMSSLVRGDAGALPPGAGHSLGQAIIAPSQATRERAAAPIKPRGRFRDKVLLAVEIVLATALLGVLIASLRTLGEVNRASREAQLLPTPSPTPLI